MDGVDDGPARAGRRADIENSILETASRLFLLGRAEAERTLSVLRDSGPPEKSGVEADGRLESRLRRVGRTGVRSREAATSVRVTSTPPMRARLPPPAAASSFPIYLYSFLIRVACRGPTPRRGAPALGYPRPCSRTFVAAAYACNRDG